TLDPGGNEKRPEPSGLARASLRAPDAGRDPDLLAEERAQVLRRGEAQVERDRRQRVLRVLEARDRRGDAHLDQLALEAGPELHQASLQGPLRVAQRARDSLDLAGGRI